ncbi:MAG: MBL fold metallo-hydrolase [Candidatus Eisenbacteria bacterium]|nr:MBL fold metallo-hydrolase [Candidatus Eisenbacteria bacterium]
MRGAPRPGGIPEITALELARALERGEPAQVLDVRLPVRVAAGRIDVAPPGRFRNRLGSQVLAARDLAELELDPARPVTVVCGHGNTSREVAAHLRSLGCPAASLQGGMAAWMALVLPRELEPVAGLDRLVQFDRIGKGSLGYLLVSDGEALILDPPRDAAAFLEAAAACGARVVGVADTHVHADYISGAARLSAELGVPYHLHPADGSYPYDGTPGRLKLNPLADGDVLRVGRCELTARHTPGHTEGSISFLAGEAAAFTGDFVFVATLGRPDLAGKSSEWAARLWESLQRARREWPPAMWIYPAHYAERSERRPDGAVGERFGDLLGRNEGFQPGDREEFLRWVEARGAGFPDAYRTIKAVNVGLVEVDEAGAEELEVGRNECALGGRQA